MLKIHRYLAITSAVLLFFALILVGWFYHQQAVRDLIAMTARHNIIVDRIMLNTIWTRYGDYLAEASDMDAETLRSRPETDEIAKAVNTLISGVQILKVKIYSKSGVTLFSTDPADVGEDYSNSAAFQSAARDGLPSSEISYSDRFTAFSGEVFHRDVVETYLPKFDEQGKIAGVFEIYSDVTEVKDRIDQTTVRLLVGLTAIFVAIYAVLVFGIMRRAIEPIRRASQKAMEIGPRAAGARLPTSGMPKEILPLIVSMNGALERLDRALDAQRRFAADSAHELLTPLAVLRAHIDTLKDSTVRAALRRDVDTMTDVVHQLLDLAELESHSGSPAGQEKADIHSVAVEVISMLAPLAVRERKNLALTGAEGAVWVNGCPRMLNRALRNLIENALSHTPAETTVEIRLSENGLIQVIDQGEGVPLDKRDTIFQRFWRGDKRTGPGAGLGLAIVKRIVEHVGGKIAVSDAPGGGACFTIQMVKAEP